MTAYKDTSFLFEETTEQVYIVNLPLVRARSEQFRSLDTAPAEEIETLWLQVDGGKPLLVSRPSPPQMEKLTPPCHGAGSPRTCRDRSVYKSTGR